METINSQGTLWLTILLAAAALHGLWLAVLLFLKTESGKGGRLLAGAFIILSLYLLNYLLFLTGSIRPAPHLLGVFYPLLFLVGPFFYFFIRQSLAPEFRLKWAHLWHLLPAALAIWKTIPLYLATAEYKLEVIDWYLNPDGSFTWAMVLLGNDFMYHIMAYVTAAWWLARKREEEQDEERNRRNARWLRQFSLGFLLLLALDLALKFSFFAFRTPAFTIEYVMASALALGIHLAGYRAIGRLGDFPRIWPASNGGNGKYKTSPLTPEQMDTCQGKLLALMKTEQPHLDASLKLSDLAARLDIPSHHLSQVLNEGMGVGFYDFVNAYRVEAAQQRLHDKKYRHYSILAIGLECGFTNKTTFNRTFKKVAGMTPSEFLNKEMA
ncbi:MAG: helix-turn-helix transcriptional regulator [Phaeodactylibacter sp.]|nr:helix-turn-helix transcriptional regulator [Phaeodactylibacter sp.]